MTISRCMKSTAAGYSAGLIWPAHLAGTSACLNTGGGLLTQAASSLVGIDQVPDARGIENKARASSPSCQTS